MIASLQKYALEAVLALVVIGGGWYFHHLKVQDAYTAAFNAGYAKHSNEDADAVAKQVTADTAKAVAQAKQSQESVDELKELLDRSNADLADARSKFAAFSVRVTPSTGATGSGISSPSTGSGSGGTGSDSANAGSQLPSLSVAGDELSKCDQQTDIFTKLREWVLVRHPIAQ